MPTNDERREVAARLRALDAWEFDEGECIDQGDVESALGIINVDEVWCEAEGVMRIADLIEPEERTCRDVSSGDEEFRCSECGAPVEVECHGITLLIGGKADNIHYCPNCGTRVVKGDGE